MNFVRRGITALAGIVLLALAVLYGGSAAVIRREVNAELPRIRAATDPAEILEGKRLAGIAGCTRCHGAGGQGQVLTDVPYIGRIVAPSIPQVAARASDEQLARVIRNGVGIDARPLYIMPGAALNRLSDQDVARLIGWVRILPTSAADVVGSTPIGVQGRFAILTRRLPDGVDLARGQPALRPADIGRYFVQSACGQCHRVAQAGPSGENGRYAPALATAVARYDGQGLKAVLQGGKRSHPGLGGLTDGEIEAIRTYLQGFAGNR